MAVASEGLYTNDTADWEERERDEMCKAFWTRKKWKYSLNLNGIPRRLKWIHMNKNAKVLKAVISRHFVMYLQCVVGQIQEDVTNYYFSSTPLHSYLSSFLIKMWHLIYSFVCSYTIINFLRNGTRASRCV